jgi:hypothetical protein
VISVILSTSPMRRRTFGWGTFAGDDERGQCASLTRRELTIDTIRRRAWCYSKSRQVFVSLRTSAFSPIPQTGPACATPTERSSSLYHRISNPTHQLCSLWHGPRTPQKPTHPKLIPTIPRHQPRSQTRDLGIRIHPHHLVLREGDERRLDSRRGDGDSWNEDLSVCMHGRVCVWFVLQKECQQPQINQNRNFSRGTTGHAGRKRGTIFLFVKPTLSESPEYPSLGSMTTALSPPLDVLVLVLVPATSPNATCAPDPPRRIC